MVNHKITGNGRDVIFLHGWGGDINSFAGLCKELSKLYRCTTLDFFGHGATPHGELPLVVDDFAKSVVQLIDKYDMQNITLIAHSFGGRVAIKLAADPRIKKLILIGAAGVKKRFSLVVKLKILRYKLKKKLGLNTSKMGSKDWQKLRVEERRTFCNVIRENLTPLLKSITQPTLLIWGKKDTETPLYMAQTMNRKIRDSGLIIFEDAGHFVYIERPREVLRIIKNFLASF